MRIDVLARCSVALVVLSLCSCYASNVVAREERAIVADVATLEWSSAPRPLAPGLYESIEIRGDAAASFWKVYYLFEDGGRYTAAALVSGTDGPEFRTLNGRWTCAEDGLVLDDQPPVPLEHAPEHVLLDAPTGSVILRRVEIH